MVGSPFNSESAFGSGMVRRTVGIVCALGLMLLVGCSEPKPPPPEPAAPVAAAPAEAVPAVAESEPEVLPQTREAVFFAEYAKQLRAGDLIQSFAHLTALKGALRGDNLDDPFWIENLPEESRLTLLVATLCVTCSDGACQQCQGKTLCPDCSGTGLCAACKGIGGDRKICTRCTCKSCGGNRHCITCKGRRFVACSTCGGSGIGRIEKKFEPCPSCGGSGYQDGLKKAGGTASRLRCIRCNGTKGVMNTVKHPCPTCGGSGRQPCTACRATGACPTCQGLGRDANCPICQGVGYYLEPCPACKGQKVCPACNGNKVCSLCHGQGTCRDCLGRNLVVRYRMPIDRRWLLRPDIRLIRPEMDRLVWETPTHATVSATIKGRTVSTDLPEASVIWISSVEELRRIREIFAVDP